MIEGIHGIAKTLNGPVFEDHNSDVQLLVIALVQLTGRLYEAAQNAGPETAEIRQLIRQS